MESSLCCLITDHSFISVNHRPFRPLPRAADAVIGDAFLTSATDTPLAAGIAFPTSAPLDAVLLSDFDLGQIRLSIRDPFGGRVTRHAAALDAPLFGIRVAAHRQRS